MCKTSFYFLRTTACTFYSNLFPRPRQSSKETKLVSCVATAFLELEWKPRLWEDNAVERLWNPAEHTEGLEERAGITHGGSDRVRTETEKPRRPRQWTSLDESVSFHLKGELSSVSIYRIPCICFLWKRFPSPWIKRDSHPTSLKYYT